MALDEATIERALTRVLGYVDPVAHALATKAAARDETTIAAALKNVLGPEAARADRHRQGRDDAPRLRRRHHEGHGAPGRARVRQRFE